jgi:hypothetical protein
MILADTLARVVGRIKQDGEQSPGSPDEGDSLNAEVSMKCTDGAKKEILAHLVAWTKAHEKPGLSAHELQSKMGPFITKLFRHYGKDCVLQVLRAWNTKTDVALS